MATEAIDLSSRTQRDGIFVTAWSAICAYARPHTSMLREFIMPLPYSSSRSSASKNVSKSSKSAPVDSSLSHIRHVACTHIRMERLYGPYLCSWCHHPSPLGWVYSCTNNDEDYLLDDELTGPKAITAVPISEQQQDGQIVDSRDKQPDDSKRADIMPVAFQSTNGHNDRKPVSAVSIREVIADTAPSKVAGEINISTDVGEPPEPEGGAEFSQPEPRLSPGIEKAIKEGHYTPEQVARLRAQRQNVLDTIKAAKKNMRLYPEISADISLPPKSSISQSIEANPYLPFPVINDIRESVKEPNPVIIAPSKPRMYPQCRHRACHNCRPTYVDRAWVRFEDVLAMETPIPSIDFETDDRPMSDLDTVRNMGFQPLEDPRDRPQFGRKGMFTRSDASIPPPMSSPRQVPAGYLASGDSAEHDEQESRGFRESMRRAFRGMLSRRGNSSFARSSWVGRSRDMPAVAFSMALWRELNDELLEEACSIPLPGHDGMDGLGDETSEVEVEGGVAVTEEGIDLGTADIIMST